MTNTMNFTTIVCDRHGFVNGHTLLFYAIMAMVAIILIYGFIRLRQSIRNSGVNLPRKMMLITGMLTMAFGVIELFLAMADWLTIEALVTPHNDPTVFRSLLGIALAHRLQMLCLPVLLSTVAFSLAVAMTSKNE